MPEEAQDTTDTGDTAPQTAQTDGAPAADADTANDKGQLYFGKYKTLEEAEKAHGELERKLGQQGNEVGELRRRAEQAEQQAQLAAALEKLADASSKKDEPEKDFQAWVQEVAEEEGVSVGLINKLAALNNDWAGQLEGKTKQDIEALRKEVLDTREQLEKARVTLTPDYQRHKDTVDALVADGMSIPKALEWAKKVAAAAAPGQPDAMDPPPNVSASRTSGRVEKPKPYLSSEDRANMKAQFGLNDAALDEMEAEHQARKKAAEGAAA